MNIHVTCFLWIFLVKNLAPLKLCEWSMLSISPKPSSCFYWPKLLVDYFFHICPALITVYFEKRTTVPNSELDVLHYKQLVRFKFLFRFRFSPNRFRALWIWSLFKIWFMWMHFCFWTTHECCFGYAIFIHNKVTRCSCCPPDQRIPKRIKSFQDGHTHICCENTNVEGCSGVPPFSWAFFVMKVLFTQMLRRREVSWSANTIKVADSARFLSTWIVPLKSIWLLISSMLATYLSAWLNSAECNLWDQNHWDALAATVMWNTCKPNLISCLSQVDGSLHH